MQIIYAQEKIQPKLPGKIIFLAGPTPRDPAVKSWRPDAIEIFEKLGFNGTLLIPEMRGGFTDDFEYGDQIDWEQDGLETVNVIMFWIPRELKLMPAFTTNIEFGYWLAKDPSKMVIGYPKGTPNMRYFDYKCGLMGNYISHDLKETIKRAMKG